MYINSHISANVGMKITHCTRKDRPYSAEYQFFVIQKGAVIVEFSDQKFTLQKDDVILFKPKESFTISPYQENTIIGIRLDPAYVNSLIPIGYRLECNSTSGSKRNYEHLVKILLEICSSFYEEKNEAKMAGLLYCLTGCIKNHHLYRIESPGDSNTDFRHEERINHIVKLIHTRYAQPLSLTALADEMYLTPQYLSKFLKKHLGVSFSRYLTTIRLQFACTELLQTDNSITNIALGNGFPNVTSFNKAFREAYHCSPTAYKQQQSSDEALIESPETFAELPLDSVTKQNLHVDAANPVPYHPVWNDTINIGLLYNVLNSSFQEAFAEYHKAMPVKYVRFENMLSQKMLPFDEETNTFNFTNLDESFHFFNQMDVYPFIELSFKKSRTSSEYLAESEQNKQQSLVRDTAHYCRAMTQILNRYLHYYGTEYLSNWRFEISALHNEYLRYEESTAAYIKKYRSYYRTIKDILPACQIGGPGFNMSSQPGVFEKFLNAFYDEKLPFDFISLFTYGYETNDTLAFDDPLSQGILSPDKDYIYHNFQKYKRLIKLGRYENLPVFITDYGSTLTIHNYIYDSLFQAAFICKTKLSLLDDCSCIAYSSFWDTIPELSFFKDMYYSTSSMISKKRIPKPSLHAYTLLAKLGKNLIAHSNSFIMTCDSSNKYQLLIFHYVHYNRNFCFNSWDPVSLENTYDIFEDADPLDIHFVCDHFPSGRYKVTQFTLNRNYGSALDKYLRILDIGNTTSSELLTTVLNFSEDEAGYYRQTSVPRRDIYHISCERQLEMNIELGAHEIQFFEFTKIL